MLDIKNLKQLIESKLAPNVLKIDKESFYPSNFLIDIAGEGFLSLMV